MAIIKRLIIVSRFLFSLFRCLSEKFPCDLNNVPVSYITGLKSYDIIDQLQYKPCAEGTYHRTYANGSAQKPADQKNHSPEKDFHNTYGNLRQALSKSYQ